MTLFTQIRELLALVLSTVMLAACGVATSMPTATLPTAASLTPSIMPTSTESPVTPSVTLSPTATSLPVFSLPDELRMAYIIDGNLYFQEGSDSPIKLTSSGEDWLLFFSENGEKIFFLRGISPPFDLYSIYTDGSSEQILVTNARLEALDASYNESTGFHSVTKVPGTHLLLFSTIERQADNRPSIWNGDLLIVDTDTAEIKRLLQPNDASGFYVSPDGRFIAIDTIGSIDVIDTGGKIIHQNVLTYTPSKPAFLAPSISWMPDSKGIVVILPIHTFYETSANGPSYTAWRYVLDESTGIQVPRDILPTDVYMATVSPDGNWIIYNNNDQVAFYIGDLRTGNTQLYVSESFVYHDFGWSPDSKYFIYSVAGARNNLFLGSPNVSPELIGKGELLGWIDANRFLYYADKNIVLGDINGSNEIILVDHESFQNPSIFTFILP